MSAVPAPSTSSEGWSVETSGETGTAAIAVIPPGAAALDLSAPGSAVVDFLIKHHDIFGPASRDDLKVVAVQKRDRLTYVRVQQLVSGIPLLGAEAVVSLDESGHVSMFTGPLRRALPDVVFPLPVSRAAASVVALNGVHARDAGVAQCADYELAHDGDVPVHRFACFGSGRAYEARVGALDGSLRFLSSTFARVQTSTDALGLSSTISRRFPVNEIKVGAPPNQRSRFRLERISPSAIRVLDANSQIVSSDALTGPWDPELVEAYTNLIAADDWARKSNGAGAGELAARRGDNSTLEIYAGLVPCEQGATAGEGENGFSLSLPLCANGSAEIPIETWVSGGRPRRTGSGRVAYTGDPDTIAHEYQHLVSSATWVPTKRGESGALDEGLSDVFAMLVREAQTGSTDFRMAALGKMPAYPLRNLLDPQSREAYQPGARRYTDRYVGSEDDGGVHWNSTIVGHAFYLKMSGGRHLDTGISVRGRLSWPEATRLYWALIHGLKSSSTFREAALRELEAAERMGAPQRATVYCAWRAVEVFARNDDATLGRGASCAPMVDAGADVVAPPAPAPDASAPPTRPADCAGRADGVYCDAYVSPRDAFVCKDQKRGPGTQCPTGKACDPSKNGQPSTQPDAFCK